MAAWVCNGCTAVYAVGAPRCPHCGGTSYVEEGQDMPKITVHGGPSDAGAPAGFTAAWGDEKPEGSEQASATQDPGAGTASSTSDEKQPTSTGTSGSDRSKRARKTASPSAQDRTDSSSAPSTGGGPADGGSATGSEQD